VKDVSSASRGGRRRATSQRMKNARNQSTRPQEQRTPQADRLQPQSAAADYLGVQPATLERWRWRGVGPRFIKIGRCVRYRRSDLEAFVAASVRTNTSGKSAVSAESE
jgi:Helix-turn-helix domain